MRKTLAVLGILSAFNFAQTARAQDTEYTFHEPDPEYTHAIEFKDMEREEPQWYSDIRHAAAPYKMDDFEMHWGRRAGSYSFGDLGPGRLELWGGADISKQCGGRRNLEGSGALVCWRWEW